MYIDCTECLNAPFGARCFLTHGRGAGGVVDDGAS